MAALGVISLRGIHFEHAHLAFNLAAGITVSDIGKAVAIDGSASNTVKLAGDGDVIFGRLEVVENRAVEGVLVGTVAVLFADRLPVKSGETVNVGDALQGAGSGEVKAVAPTLESASGAQAIALAKHNRAPVAVEVAGGYAVAVKL